MFKQVTSNFRHLRIVLSAIFSLVCLIIIAVYSLVVLSEHSRARYNFELNIWKDLSQDGRERPFNADPRCLPLPGTAYEVASDGERPPVASALKKNFNVFNHRMYQRLLLTDALVWLVVSVAGYYFIAWILRPVRDNVSAQQEFIANASHELKTPITTIKTELSLLEAEKMSGSVRASVKTIKDETDNLRSLVEKLLLAVSGSEQTETACRTDLRKLVRERLAVWRKVYIQRRLRFELLGDNVNIVTKPQVLMTLMDLLLDNAGKYADEKTTVKVELQQFDREVWVDVVNQGLGISREQQEKIWGRFYRVTDRRVQAQAGSGLGLAIAKDLVTNLGGSIQLISGSPDETRFRVVLPAA